MDNMSEGRVSGNGGAASEGDEEERKEVFVSVCLFISSVSNEVFLPRLLTSRSSFNRVARFLSAV